MYNASISLVDVHIARSDVDIVKTEGYNNFSLSYVGCKSGGV
jgi:hypothetical protein